MQQPVMQYRLLTVDVMRPKTRLVLGLRHEPTITAEQLREVVAGHELWYLSNETAKRRFEPSVVKPDAQGVYHMENGNDYCVRVCEPEGWCRPVG